MFGRRNLVGLDIGSSSVKAAQIEVGRRGCRVVGVAVEPIRRQSVVDGTLVEADPVVGAIRRACSRRRFRREACVGLSGSAVIVKKVTVAPPTDTELEDSVLWEASQHLPFGIHDVNLDYHVLPPSTEPGSNDGRDVLLAAAKRDTIRDYSSVMVQAGLRPAVIDLGVFALQNAYEANYETDVPGLVVLLDAGASAVTVSVLQRTGCVFTRGIPMGGDAYTDALQKELGISFDAAEQVKTGIPVDRVSFDEVRPVLWAVTDNILLELQKALGALPGFPSEVGRILLSGGAAAVDGFEAMVRDRFGKPVGYFDPFRRIPCAIGTTSPPPAELALTVAVAVGLALRRPDRGRRWRR